MSKQEMGLKSEYNEITISASAESWREVCQPTLASHLAFTDTNWIINCKTCTRTSRNPCSKSMNVGKPPTYN
jgi:hypothetical protein